MDIEVKQLPRGRAEITVTLSVDEYQPHLEHATKHISEHVTIPGFRPGKATREMIIQHVGEARLWEEALEPAVKATLSKAITEKNLMTVGAPQVDVVTLAPGNPVAYRATVNILPSVTVADLKKIKVERKPVEVTDDQINIFLDGLRESRASEALVERPAQIGDKAEVDIDTFLDKVPVEHGQNKKLPITLGKKSFIPGFEENVIGMKTGETKEFQLTFPKNYHHTVVAGKLVDFKVTMQSVFERTIPEANDTFAQSMGSFKTMDELRSRVKENMLAEQADRVRHELEESILDELVEKSTFGDVPDILVDSESKKMLEELQRNITQQGLKFEDYMAHLKKNSEQLLLEFIPQAIKRIKSALALREIAKINTITATDEDIDQETQKILADYGNTPEAQQAVKEQGFRDYLKNIITTRKVMQFVVDTVAPAEKK